VPAGSAVIFAGRALGALEQELGAAAPLKGRLDPAALIHQAGWIPFQSCWV
jgi:hypothetical protein